MADFHRRHHHGQCWLHSCPLLGLLPTAVTLMLQEANLITSGLLNSLLWLPTVLRGKFRVCLIASSPTSHSHLRASWVPPLPAADHQPGVSHPNPQEPPAPQPARPSSHAASSRKPSFSACIGIL